jgi:hypothetical protein
VRRRENTAESDVVKVTSFFRKGCKSCSTMSIYFVRDEGTRGHHGVLYTRSASAFLGSAHGEDGAEPDGMHHEADHTVGVSREEGG